MKGTISLFHKQVYLCNKKHRIDLNYKFSLQLSPEMLSLVLIQSFSFDCKPEVLVHIMFLFSKL